MHAINTISLRVSNYDFGTGVGYSKAWRMTVI